MSHAFHQIEFFSMAPFLYKRAYCLHTLRVGSQPLLFALKGGTLGTRKQYAYKRDKPVFKINYVVNLGDFMILGLYQKFSKSSKVVKK